MSVNLSFEPNIYSVTFILLNNSSECLTFSLETKKKRFPAPIQEDIAAESRVEFLSFELDFLLFFANTPSMSENMHFTYLLCVNSFNHC